MNPAGIGITGDPAQNAASPTFATGTDAARAHLAHLLVYALGPTDAGSAWFRATGTSISAVDSRYDDYLAAYGDTVQAETIADLSGTWATDPHYAEGIVARGNAIFTGIPDQGGTVTYTTTVPGLPGGALTTDYPIRVDLIGISPRQRPGTKARTPRRSVQHGNGNPNSSAAGERNFLHSLAGSDTWLSYHATGDDRELYVLVPLDEVTWQAADGGGPGNLNGYSCEMVEDAALWADPARRDRVIHVCADFMGRAAARFAVPQPERHWDFNWVECCDSPCDVQCGERHHCPNQLMSRGLWDATYVPRWIAAKNDELARMGGGGTTTMYPEGMDEGIAERCFGKVKGEDGKQYSFNPNGIISNLWLSQGKATGDFPQIEAVWVYGDGRKYFRFRSGLILWQTSETAPPAVLK